ncbi:MAG: hypothetical protein QGG64_22510 [Candidatus Latescibacteria bacterium]|nr:hypothetical protein [Candidatus Latescibacterota bacterium]
MIFSFGLFIFLSNLFTIYIGKVMAVFSKEMLARHISRILNPMVVLTFVIVLVAVEEPGADIHVAILASILFTFSVLIPILLVLYMRWKGQINHLFIAERHRRLRALFFVTGSFWLGCGILNILSAPLGLRVLMGCVAVLGGLALFVTWQWKISLHAVGIWACYAIIMSIYGANAWFAIVPACAVSWARLALRAHSLAQVLGGSVMGVVVPVLFFYLMGAGV